MLTLSRRVGESFEIKCEGTTFRVMVVAFEGQKVKIGFEAPRHVVVTREELLQKKE